MTKCNYITNLLSVFKSVLWLLAKAKLQDERKMLVIYLNLSLGILDYF